MKTEELTLKHLAPYLQYGLKILRPDNKTILQMIGIIGSSMVFHEKSGDTFGFIGNQNKPILRPLSDLTKEIEVNGEKFVPIEKICKNVYQQNKVLFSINNLIEGVTGIYYYQVEKLFEWHFDIFNLIPKGLAIDINTL